MADAEPPVTNTTSPSSVQQPEFLAKIHGEIFAELPTDLYIPPDALRIFLETFEGPLDLLLYLIKKQNINILDIPIVEITRQYVTYVELMREVRLELAAEYMLMAAMLMEIKSRMLLPKPELVEEDEEDPRADLVRRLQIYEQFKKASEELDALPCIERDFFAANCAKPNFSLTVPQPEVSMNELNRVLAEVLKRAKLFSQHEIMREVMSVRERMSAILQRIQDNAYLEFHALFTVEEGRMGVVVTFIAILELQKQSLLRIAQNEPYAPIYVKAIES
ncbi:MAG: chromosome segregation protein ScpA [Gammaproteobacteria bacterium RIFCSPHIGHO2_12_FULL_41_15]|nr:MAG: chromosome segregation protein ScpA [Gammaproteobacteria bacterium RIFCSPHIGHO2_12_FULL_41_15]